MIVVEVHDEAATAHFAARIARLAQPGDIIALQGDLGAGKTTFARAFIRAYDNGQGEVPSPTFTLVQIYEVGPAPVWHFDLYRLRTPGDAWELGIEDAFAAGISLIEWPERLGALLPDRRLEITFEFAARPSTRRVSLDPGKGWQTRLAAMAANA